jgi:aspartyl-tRNA(Asn)/glutamyl-tRNA(Gln) amidotransferase subunit A
MNASQVLHDLHGVRSRSDDQAVTTEVLRLNQAARQAARGQLTGWDQPGHFSATLIANADPFKAHHSSIQNRNQATGLIARLGEALRRRELSVGELVERALRRATEAQHAHRAFIEIFFDKARASARKLDEEIAQGRWRGPLHGIPLAHKDCLERVDRAPTVGSIATDLARPDLDATVLTRLEQAGSVDIGALNLNEMVAGPTGHNPHFGDCANAIDPSRIGGGSSSGSAVAVRLGIVAGSLGSDTGGSIRIPAAVNGVPGLKPTYGRISRAGCFPRAFSLDCVGPLAASIDDCELLFNAVAATDPRDPSSIDRPSHLAAHASERPTDTSRVAVLGGYGDLSPDVQSAFNRFVSRCEAELGPLAPQRTLELHTLYAMGDIISKVEAAAIHGDWMSRHPERYSQAVYSRTEPGFHLPAVRYVEAINLRARLLSQFIERAFDDADVLVFPALPVPVPTRIEADMEQGSRVFPVVAQLTRLTRPFSYLGLPVLTVPIGDDRNSMPVAAQLIGLPFGEARLFDVARRLIRDRLLCDDSGLLRD